LGTTGRGKPNKEMNPANKTALVWSDMHDAMLVREQIADQN
jgi:hypothetical protein